MYSTFAKNLTGSNLKDVDKKLHREYPEIQESVQKEDKYKKLYVIFYTLFCEGFQRDMTPTNAPVTERAPE